MGLPASAAPLSPLEQARAFADCAGRYTALTEHQWMFDGPASETSARRRDAFAGLLDAVGPDLAADDAAHLLDWRVAARAAQRDLLDAAAFARSDGQRRRASALAVRFIASCDRLTPGV